jgi:hypothetical protein
MPSLSYLQIQRRKIWITSVIVLAVGSLTLNLATRYYSPWDASSITVKSFRTHAAPDAKRQRLTKNAATWMPPVSSFSALQVPGSYLSIASVQPAVRSLICDKSLYNRPPPAVQTLS